MSENKISPAVTPAKDGSVVEEGQQRAKDFFQQQNNMMEQQATFMSHMGYNVDDPPAKPKEDEAPPVKKIILDQDIEDYGGSTSTKTGNESSISLHADDDEYTQELEHGDDDEDPWAETRKSKELSEDVDYGNLEDILCSKYQTMLNQTEEELGDPLSDALAKVCEKAWGQAKLSKEKKHELLKDVKIPSNCPRMKTPKLNTVVYLRLRENHQTKDKGAQDRQKEITKAVVLLLQALDKVTEVQELLKANAKRDVAKHPLTKYERDAYKKMGEIDELGQRCWGILNYTVTDTNRKRRYDVCNGLGSQFKPFAGTIDPASPSERKQ